MTIAGIYKRENKDWNAVFRLRGMIQSIFEVSTNLKVWQNFEARARNIRDSNPSRDNKLRF